MATIANGIFKHIAIGNSQKFKSLLHLRLPIINNVRGNHMFKHLAQNKKHDQNYLYEVSKDPKEWEFVQKLLPLETVPAPKSKSHYPSGWKPAESTALQHPYYVERTKNHMLPVYLKIYPNEVHKVTIVKKIHGDLWKFHNELKAHIEKETGKKIASFVHEGNCVIKFREDLVFFVEQWLLKKGF